MESKVAPFSALPSNSPFPVKVAALTQKKIPDLLPPFPGAACDTANVSRVVKNAASSLIMHLGFLASVGRQTKPFACVHVGQPRLEICRGRRPGKILIQDLDGYKRWFTVLRNMESYDESKTVFVIKTAIDTRHLRQSSYPTLVKARRRLCPVAQSS
ncbi:uncharacterized protein LY79DRAFT_583607 [Colletotrichum navitas]|uniref:Uncharacterized protein n=1 Tax=Colletotrichum navitas TaxID=681940 RepID=A0AAD8V0P5_9PEZI|nr:uncharacterized protein LY79DRAFT_583607 [Colletotrichum navitas]KAK1573479.1 hypothetical protein LY79DRAFT_583607 [Colletotrichum navitas]